MIVTFDAPLDLVAMCGYADQAHLTREWRVLAGVTPGAWLAEGDFVPSDEVTRA
jgi:AraC-like DNA-binding protein